MRTVRHSVQQLNIIAKTMRNQNNNIAPNMQDTFIISNLPKTQ